ncbi:oxidoreductase [Mangrovactinospora gilvigrisea]|uniref:Oxidoreductase n=1 Tax=Mangrovactinospora gilvigrisea TaxID=1428644 RepID=A0A1J7BC71_9ACTN|nr:Gfo/Idh/MocA family oxidoreductase [Mangrovactinospora gilvigrisea]OIV36287.1 oxidoreductase [Mangrovactinospora gilvigrisea]
MVEERPELRVAVVGYGLGGRAFHAPFVAAEPGLRLAAVVTGDPERGAAVAARYPDTEVVKQVDEVFARSGDFDAVVVTTPNGTHAGLARQALEAGLHAVVDKPLAGTSAAARELFALAEARGLVLQAYQNRRFDGDFRTLRGLIAEGRLGAVRRFESRFERWRPVPKGGWKEDGDPAHLGGILFDLGTHVIDQAVALFGRPERVYAEVLSRREGDATDDDAFVALTHRGGVLAHLWVSAVAPDLGPRMRVLGDRAAYVKHGMDVQEAALRDGAVPGGPGWGAEPEEAWGVLGDVTDGFAPVPTVNGDYGAFYRGFAAAVREAGGSPRLPVPPAESVAVLEVIEAARHSAAAGGAVELSGDPG